MDLDEVFKPFDENSLATEPWHGADSPRQGEWELCGKSDASFTYSQRQGDSIALEPGTMTMISVQEQEVPSDEYHCGGLTGFRAREPILDDCVDPEFLGAYLSVLNNTSIFS